MKSFDGSAKEQERQDFFCILKTVFCSFYDLLFEKEKENGQTYFCYLDSAKLFVAAYNRSD